MPFGVALYSLDLGVRLPTDGASFPAGHGEVAVMVLAAFIGGFALGRMTLRRR